MMPIIASDILIGFRRFLGVGMYPFQYPVAHFNLLHPSAASDARRTPFAAANHG